MYPEDPRAPFYDPTGGEMQPLARLYLRREAVTPRPCGDPDAGAGAGGRSELVEEVDNAEDTARPECAVTEYSEWSPCSVTCGKGLRMRQRAYLNPDKAAMLGCGRQLLSKEMCVARAPSCPGDPDDDDLLLLVHGAGADEAVCATSDWGSWSECSVSCGAGVRTRMRRFLDRMGFKKCPRVELKEMEKCMMPPCSGLGGARASDDEDASCPVTAWSDWSPCSASCGRGVNLRTRLLLAEPELQQMCGQRRELVQTRHCEERPDCRLDPLEAKQVCMMEADPGECRGFFQRWYYETRKEMCVPFGYGGCRGNRNNFMTAEECNQACSIMRGIPPTHFSSNVLSDSIAREPVNCVLSSWGAWSGCSVSCGKGTKVRERTILVHPQNGGKACPHRLTRKRKCQGPPCE